MWGFECQHWPGKFLVQYVIFRKGGQGGKDGDNSNVRLLILLQKISKCGSVKLVVQDTLSSSPCRNDWPAEEVG